MASITVDQILAASPVTTRGQPTPLSADSKGQRIAYAVSAVYAELQCACLETIASLLK